MRCMSLASGMSSTFSPDVPLASLCAAMPQIQRVHQYLGRYACRSLSAGFRLWRVQECLRKLIYRINTAICMGNYYGWRVARLFHLVPPMGSALSKVIAVRGTLARGIQQFPRCSRGAGEQGSRSTTYYRSMVHRDSPAPPHHKADYG